MKSIIKDPKLAAQGKKSIDYAETSMGALLKVKESFHKKKPFKGLTIGMALHITKETAVLVRTLQAGGAKVAITGCNPLSTQDDVAAALTKEGALVFGHRGESNRDYYRFLNKVIEAKPDITIDDGCDLVTEIHLKHKKLLPKIIGGCEETTTGIIRVKAMEKDGALKYPVIAVNDNKTKHLMDNLYGTGQSTLDGIIRTTNILLAGKTVVVAGYGSCGKGCAMRARGMGANVVVTEVDPFRALQATMDGFRVMKMVDAAKIGDLFITVTGDIDVIVKKHMLSMKNGAILANSGHFNNEINLSDISAISSSKREIRPNLVEYAVKKKRLLLCAEGRLVNLAGAEGHPSEVMSLSFCGQALACEYLVNKTSSLKPEVYTLPPSIDEKISKLQLAALGIEIDKLTPAQKKYLSSWEEGT